MIAGLTGSLFSHDALEHLLHHPGRWGLDLDAQAAAQGGLRHWYSSARKELGPTASARVVFDRVAEPLARALGFSVVPVSSGAHRETVDALLHAGSARAAVMVVSAWGQPSAGLWRHAVHCGLAHDVRWCLCVTGPALRVFDAERAYARRFAEFELDVALEDDRTLRVLAGLFSAAAVGTRSTPGTLQQALAACERHRTEVRLSLRDGVSTALVTFVRAFRTAVSKRHADAQLLNESLIVVYRILFLLFAEARGLVPTWHPIYAHNYTIESVSAAVERGALPAGLWETLQAVARLAHRGCLAGSLRVPPFNGRLFSPSDAPLADALPLDDSVVSQALIALTTKQAKDERQRISYADLGVEQLGGVYEHLLDFDIASDQRQSAAVLVATGRRKATGSFYTPRSLTEFLVRRTLAPLVQNRTPDEILSLRLLDPAMGSGAFLVAACRYLAVAYEQSLIRAGSVTAADLDAKDRAEFRRAVAQRCLFGVDVNPMAVQLGRLSLWLATLASDKPLTFLDHRLRTGNSLIGASIDDVRRQPAPGSTARSTGELPLFPGEALQRSLECAVDIRLKLAAIPDDTLLQVREKEQSLARLGRSDGPLERWKRAANLWCASWFTGEGRSRDRAVFGALLDRILRESASLPAHVADPFLLKAEATAARHCFFHWTLEFPEVFYDNDGNPLAQPGFDAVLGNPPWDMLRDDGTTSRNGDLTRFVRRSDLFRLQGGGHGNLYQLFMERAIELLKRGGRCGMILPSGFGTDQACGALRRHLFNRTTVDTYTVLENRDGIFPIHRALKFLLLTFMNSGRTTELPSRTDVRSAEALDRVPDAGAGGSEVFLPIELIARISGEGLAVPEIRTSLDLEIAAGLAIRLPATADPTGWGIHFGRELNATDDRRHFSEGPGMPVIEGKHMRPFHVDTDAARSRIPRRIAKRLLDSDATFDRMRLAYRDVASASNRTTLIAALVPAQTVTTHTVFCLKEALDEDAQLFLCGVFNSYVANYLIRMRVGTHVTAAIVARLPVPKPTVGSPAFRRVVAFARQLAHEYSLPTAARLNVAVARLYGLTDRQFSRVVDTFPLVDARERAEALRLFVEDNV
jgi:hypothetical protein